jgi:hypothetical protein
MKSYAITLPCGRQFSYITDTPLAELAAAIFERFRVYPVSVKEL